MPLAQRVSNWLTSVSLVSIQRVEGATDPIEIRASNPSSINRAASVSRPALVRSASSMGTNEERMS